MVKVLVTGSSGFIGGHLVRRLKSKGYYVIGVDIELPKYEKPDIFYQLDLRSQNQCNSIFNSNCDISEVYNLACLMGGMGYIGATEHSHDIMIGSTLIIANVLDCCVRGKIEKYFYSSSACVYNMNYQDKENSPALSEHMAIPSQPDLMYGWQKLCGELMAQATNEQYGLKIRIARFHNIFGIEGIWDGGKEKAPAALCRKISHSKGAEPIIVWGDGSQRRSFLYIDECLDGVEKLMDSDCKEPINIGSDEDVSIRKLAEMIIEISGKNISIEYDTTKPQGVRGRNSNNDKCLKILGWKPSDKLYDGLKKTYDFINNQMNK